MLKCDLGLVHMEGPAPIIIAEFNTLVNSMTEEFPKEVIIQAFEDGLNGPCCKCGKCSDDSEREDDNPDIISLVLDGILEGLKEAFKDKDEHSKKAADKDKKEE